MLNPNEFYYDKIVYCLEKQIKKLSIMKMKTNNEKTKKVLDKEIRKLDIAWYNYLCSYNNFVRKTNK